MHIKAFLVSITFLSVVTIGFGSKTDSLQLLLHKSKGSERIDLLVKIAKQHWYTDTDLSLDYSFEALNLSQLSGNKKQQADALNAIGGSYYFMAIPDSAIQYWRSSLLMSEQIKYEEGIARSANNLGLAFSYIGDYDLAIQYYYMSLQHEQDNNNKAGIASAYMNLGNLFFRLEDFDKSLEYATNSLRLYQKLEDDLGILKCYNNIGSIYSELEFFDNALSYAENALELSQQIGNEDLESASLNNLGKIYFGKSNYTESLKYYEQALKLAAQNDDFWTQANTIRNLGGVYLEQGNLEKAKLYFEQAIVMTAQIQATDMLADLYFDLSQVYELEKDYKNSLVYHKKYTILKDSLFNDESRNKIAQTEVSYKLRYKDQLLDFARQKNEVSALKINNQRYFLWALSSFSLFVFSLFLIFYVRARANKKSAKILEITNRKISDQKILLEKTISELKESQNKYIALTNSLQDGLVIIQDKKLLFANKTLANLLKYKTPDELLELKPEDVIVKDDLKRIVTNYKKRISGKKVPSNYEFSLLTKDKKPVEITFCAKTAEIHGKPAVIGTIKEVTNAKKYEERLIEEKNRAENATKSKSYFLAGISHEIRNQMNSISGIADELSETPLSTEQKEYVDIIKLSGSNILNIINEVLDLSKIEAGQINLENKPFTIRRLVKEIVMMHSLVVKQLNLEMDYQIEESIPDNLVGDPIRLSQILINLVGNALKFTDKGSITIKISVLNQSKTKCALKFEIIDTGIGITKENQKKLFLPFSQTKDALLRKQDGTGLGLAISKQLVNLMDGDIGVISKVRNGSNFWFTANFEIELNTKPVNPESPVDSNKLIDPKILLVEDNPLNVQLTLNILKKDGYKADVAENGKIGVELFKKNKYDVVLMDIQMPVMDGIEATRVIRKFETQMKLNQATIIAITAHAKEGEKSNLFNAGMNHYISKPFKPRQLLDIIHKL
jgi:PAS domain S-box-containing protein